MCVCARVCVCVCVCVRVRVCVCVIRGEGGSVELTNPCRSLKV